MTRSAAQGVFQTLLKARGFKSRTELKNYLDIDYRSLHDPTDLPDMKVAVERLVLAKKNNEMVCVYGDYDVDGLTATTLLLDAFSDFGIETVSYIPNRFSEGYGLSEKGIKLAAERGAKLIVTVDCGSRSLDEIKLATELGLDVIVTDHHNLGEQLPQCVAVVNAKRKDSEYPFKELAGVGVAFKLVQALQSKIDGLAKGQEKWLLDLVALGTTCDVVSMTGENRVLTKWGIEVAKKSRRPAFGALSTVSGSQKGSTNTETFSFRFGPRLNAAGRLKTAQKGLDLLVTKDVTQAMTLATELDGLNTERRNEQNRIFEEVVAKAINDDNEVLVLSDKSWLQGVVGIVASKTVERFQKPAFILQVLDDETKGSARSFGDFHLADALSAVSKQIIKGGGHAMAAGVTLETNKIESFTKAINSYYKTLDLDDQRKFLEPTVDLILENLTGVDEELVELVKQLEPFGSDNERPVFEVELNVLEARPVGSDKTHLKARFADEGGTQIDAIGFGLVEGFDLKAKKARVQFRVGLNSFNGSTNVQLELMGIDSIKS